MSKNFIILVTILVAGFLGLILFQQSKSEPNGSGQGSNNVYGKLDSSVTLTEFVDFQCEACSAYYPTVKEIKEKYKDKVKFQIKHFPISSGHANALAAAAAAQAAAKQGKFFEMHDMLFEGQSNWSSSKNRDDFFASYAQEIGLNMEQYRADLSSEETRGIINTDLAEVKRLGGDGTPTFVLNGEKIDNPDNSVEAFSALLDEALAKSAN